MSKIWEFHNAGEIIFGEGSVNRLNSLFSKYDAGRILVVTDQGIVKAGILDRTLASINQEQYSIKIYDQGIPEPPIETALDCYQEAQSFEPDLIIGLGGGSSIDLAKVVALLVTHGGEIKDYVGENKVPGPVLPLIAIPTTAGTGSEVTPVAVLTDKQNELKVGISDNFLRPSVALLDPELTLGLPPYVTACSGIDALSHAIESFAAVDHRYLTAEGNVLFQGSVPLTDTLAKEAIQLIVENLPKAVHQGKNIEARKGMLLGSLLAGMAFSNAGTASAHALAYPIGGLVDSPHGEVTGLLLPYVMKFNLPTQEKKYAELAPFFDVSSDLSNPEKALKVIEGVRDLLLKVDLPTTLDQIGIRKETVRLIAEKAIRIERLVRISPRVPTIDSYTQLLNNALTGNIQ